jgi:hypothetical protein
LQDRAKDSRAGDNLAGEMTQAEVKECTSEAIGSDSEGSVFDVAIDNFERIRNRAENLLAQAIKYSFASTFRQYYTKPQWTTVGDASASGKTSILAVALENAKSETDASNITITAELDQPLVVCHCSIILSRGMANLSRRF